MYISAEMSCMAMRYISVLKFLCCMAMWFCIFLCRMAMWFPVQKFYYISAEISSTKLYFSRNIFYKIIFLPKYLLQNYISAEISSTKLYFSRNILYKIIFFVLYGHVVFVLFFVLYGHAGFCIVFVLYGHV